MSWGGSALAMIISLKNNKRPKRELFRAYGKHNTLSKKRMRYKAASEEELRNIREIIRKENRRSIILQLTIVAVLLGLAIYAAIFLIFEYKIF